MVIVKLSWRRIWLALPMAFLFLVFGTPTFFMLLIMEKIGWIEYQDSDDLAFENAFANPNEETKETNPGCENI